VTRRRCKRCRKGWTWRRCQCRGAKPADAPSVPMIRLQTSSSPTSVSARRPLVNYCYSVEVHSVRCCLSLVFSYRMLMFNPVVTTTRFRFRFDFWFDCATTVRRPMSLSQAGWVTWPAPIAYLCVCGGGVLLHWGLNK